MPTSYRQQIVTAILARFAAINGAGDFNFDLSTKVHEWRHLNMVPWVASELPAVNVLDRAETTEQMLSGVHIHALTIDVLGAVASGPSTGSDARKLIADLTEAIRSDRKWGGLAYDTDPVSSEIAIEHENDRIAHVKFTFRVRYRTKSFDPYETQ